MRKIVHISDLHFGKIYQPAIEPLIGEVWAVKPDLVAVSGDLTQRARPSQFQMAKAFLERLPKPQIVVPGNHDIPLYNLWARFFRPLSRYKKYITNDLAPVYADDEIAVLGVNTTRALVRKGGRINREQVTAICQNFANLDKRTKLVVTHHPFDFPQGFTRLDLVGRARMAMKAFRKCGVDLFLSGHLHVAFMGNTARYKIAGYSALVIEAGTATSIRRQGRLNSYNIIYIEKPQITVETSTWYAEQGKFAISQRSQFFHTPEGWTPLQK